MSTVDVCTGTEILLALTVFNAEKKLRLVRDSINVCIEMATSISECDMFDVVYTRVKEGFFNLKAFTIALTEIPSRTSKGHI